MLTNNMKKYSYYIDTKIITYERAYYNFEAESQEEAERIIKLVAEDGYYNSEIPKEIRSHLDNTVEYKILDEYSECYENSLGEKVYEIYNDETDEQLDI